MVILYRRLQYFSNASSTGCNLRLSPSFANSRNPELHECKIEAFNFYHLLSDSEADIKKFKPFSSGFSTSQQPSLSTDKLDGGLSWSILFHRSTPVS